MPEYCSCGTQLVPDALFCHKCGKPQREIVAPASVLEPAPPPVSYSAVPPKIEPIAVSLRNPTVLRIALSLAIVSSILNLYVPYLTCIAAGFLAVFFYRRRTGFSINVHAGVRLGWFTGLLAFPLSAALFAVLVMPNLGPTLQERISNMPAADPEVARQMQQFLQTSSGMLAVDLGFLLMLFILTTLLSMAGGALGAKMVGRG